MSRLTQVSGSEQFSDLWHHAPRDETGLDLGKHCDLGPGRLRVSAQQPGQPVTECSR